ncbi:hypothetical protein V8E55_010674 [Tylopilus felleus]
MTEYTTSPEAIQVFRNSKDRTAHWVSSHSSYHSDFRSPDSPPSVVGDLEDRESDEGSSHSLPPKMVLRYGGGRADIPISQWHYENAHDPHRGPVSHPRPHTAYHSHDRAKSAADAYPRPQMRYHHHAAHHHHPPPRHALPRARQDNFSALPEEIHILPSDPNVQPHRPTGTYRPRRASEPQRRQPGPPQPIPLDDDEPEVIEPLPPRYPPNQGPPPVVYSHSQHIHDPYDHQHPSHSHSRGNRPPPSIVYTPGHHHVGNHYAPPTIVYAPHKAPGMTHTVSAPTGSGFPPQYPRITATPYNPVRSNLSSVHEEPRYGSRGLLHRENSIHRAPSPISDDSGGSGGTYYIIPTPGQKVKVLAGPEPSLYTASSTTKSASTPRSPYSGASSGVGGMKKPLFSRLMSFASDLRPSRKFPHRRHSLDHSVRARSRDR